MYFTISYILKAVFNELFMFLLAIGAIFIMIRIAINCLDTAREFTDDILHFSDPFDMYETKNSKIVGAILILAVSGILVYHIVGIPNGKDIERNKGKDYNMVERVAITASNQVKYSLTVRLYKNLEESVVKDKLSDLELLRKKTEINDEKEIHKLRYLERRENKLMKRKESLKEYFRLAKKS